MTAVFYFLLLTLLGFGLVYVFVKSPPEQIARLMRIGLPMGLILVGGLLTLVGRGGIGIPLAGIGLAWFQRVRSTGMLSGSGGKRASTVRSVAFEMQLDHDTGEMDGRVLTGAAEGRILSELSQSELISIYAVIRSDEESVALLEAYLDRRFPDWREDTQANAGTGKGGSATSCPMTKEEAYQVLGLEPGASPEEIRLAWRNLMKVMHPDSGGSAFLAAKINVAKDMLLN
jgi:DnaJ-domain-containing protein 1